MSTRVVFVDQVGGTPGGAERTLATFLRFAPADILASAVLFEDGTFADELRALGIHVDVVAAPGEIAHATREAGGMRAALRAPAMVGRVARAFDALAPDVVYTNSMKAHAIGSAAARLTGTPCIIHFHDLFTGSALRMLRGIARVGSDRRIACSHLVADAMGVGRTEVIYSPVELAAYDALDDRDVARAKLGIADDLPLVALVGRINRWKGHDRFVRIAARVNAVMPVRFAIVGAPVFRDADFVPELESLVAELGLGERVSFHPWVDDVRSVYAAIDLNANCSTREPFGRSAVEAAAASTPTICFADSGAAETIRDGLDGRCIPAGDEAAFADAIVDLLANREKRLAYARAARHGAARFDAPRIAEEMAGTIRRTADSRRRKRSA